MGNPIHTESKKEVEVMYQKVGDKWYAFSIVGDEVFYSVISDDQIQEIETRQRAVVRLDQ